MVVMLFSAVLCSLALFVFLFILCFFLSPCISLSLSCWCFYLFCFFFCTAAEVVVAAAVMSFFIFRSQPFCVTALPNEAVPPFATFRPSSWPTTPEPPLPAQRHPPVTLVKPTPFLALQWKISEEKRKENLGRQHNKAGILFYARL